MLFNGDRKLLYSIGIKLVKVYKSKQNTGQIDTRYTGNLNPICLFAIRYLKNSTL